MGNRFVAHINILLFCALAFVVLPVTNGDLLYTWQEYGLFAQGRMFFDEVAASDGVWAWTGCYLTQFFYYPWLGSAMLVALWTGIYYLQVSAFCLKGWRSVMALVAPACFLVSVVDVGYWIYYIPSQGYCFSYTVCFFVATALAWCLARGARSWTGRGWRIVTATAMIIVLFLVGYRVPEFAHGEYRDCAMEVPFIVAAFSPLLLALPFDRLKRAGGAAYAAVLVAIPVIVASRNFGDSNFHSELKMYRALDELRYEDVAAEAEAAETEPTNLMVLYKNIALLHLGRATEMFQTNNCGVQPNADEDMNVRIAHISGEMVYFQFGQINYAFRWAIENSVKRGMSVARLKMLVRCAIFNQEFDVARKYLALLRRTTFHRTWAREHELWVVFGPKFFDSKEFATLRPLLNDAPNRLDKDDDLIEQWLLKHFTSLPQPTSAKLEDLMLCTALWIEDTSAFVAHFNGYYQRHKYQPIPTLYQEALILLGNTGTLPPTFAAFPFDHSVRERYNAFAYEYQALAQQNMDVKQIGERLRAAYGDTYWWYYYFYNDFIIY